MNDVRSYRDLDIWRRSMDVVVRLYRLTATLPKSERFSLVDQMQRAAVSVPSNIAEGHEKQSTKSYRFHLKVARASIAELETQIEISVRLEYAEPTRVSGLVSELAEISRMIAAIIRKLDERADN